MWRRLSLLDRFFLIHRSAVQVLVLSFLPESPRWLLALHTPAECLESMRTLRRTNDVSLWYSHLFDVVNGLLSSYIPSVHH